MEIDNQKLLLSAVNILLQTINEQGLEDDEDLAVSLEGKEAVKVLTETKNTVLARGWDFNTDEGYKLTPDSSGFIQVPYNVLDISGVSKSIVMREWNLYDKDNQTRKFDEPVSCNIVWNANFNDITHPIRHYITIRAARVFQARMIGDGNQYTFTQQDEQLALIDAKESEGRTGKYNMLESSFGINLQQRN